MPAKTLAVGLLPFILYLMATVFHLLSLKGKQHNNLNRHFI